MNIEMSKAEEDEARLTAYALGELDAETAEQVEALLAESAEARESLQEIRSTVALLAAEISREPRLSLHDAQVEAITGEAKIVRGDFFSRHRNALSLGAVAACACLLAAVGMKQYLAGLEGREDSAMAAPVGEESGGVTTSGEKRIAPRAEVEDALPAGLEEPAAARGLVRPEEPLVLADAQSVEEADMEAPVVMRSKAEEKSDSDRSRQAIRGGAGAGAAPAGKALSEPAGMAPPSSDKGGQERRKEAGEMEALKHEIKKDRAIAAKEATDAAAEGESGSVVATPRSRAVTAPAPAPNPTAAPQSTPSRTQSQKMAPKPAAQRRDRNSAGAAPEPAIPAAPDADPAVAGQIQVESGAGGGAGTDATARNALAGLAKRRAVGAADGESYAPLVDNPWVTTAEDHRSTFAVDVDTGTYPNVRRYLARRGALPPKDAVRIEEMVNYFDYDYPSPEPGAEVPFAVDMEVASCPWARDHRLLRIGLRGRGLAAGKRPPSNLVFLVDVSGSMRGADRLDLLKRSAKAMVAQLDEDDRVGIVSYAEESVVVLPPTHGDLKDKITGALDGLKAGGSTNGASGLAQAYSLAKANFVEGGTNRVILATDGDFNVGATEKGELVSLVEERARENIFLTVLGFGEENLKEDRLEQIADKGNGSYHYLDSEKEGQKVLVSGLGATLVTVAKDVKVQVAFNQAKIAQYRLLGYANRQLPDESIDDDAVDAGEIGAGHTVTALYEIVPAAAAAVPEPAVASDDRRPAGEVAPSPEMLTLTLNYKLPEEKSAAGPIEVPLVDPGKNWEESSEDFRFAAAVAGFGLLLRESDYAGILTYDLLLELANEGIPEVGDARLGLRAEFRELVKIAKKLSEGER